MKENLPFEVRLVRYSRKFLDLSWQWFRDEELRTMTITPDFQREEQIKWFDQISNRNDYLIWGVIANGMPVGACGIKNIKNGEGEYWIYIGVKDLRGKGIGSQIIMLIEEKAIKLGLKSLWLKVLDTNSAAVGFHLNKGFLEYNREGNRVFMHKNLKVSAGKGNQLFRDR